MAEAPRRASGPGGGTDKTKISAGFLKVFDVGTLILGDSGVGKSESALELISRGHKFIADDVVEIVKMPDGTLVGSAPALSRNFMEIRGLGIINIREIFGTRSIARRAPIELMIKLKRWRRGYEVDRLGLKIPDDEIILGTKIPQLSIPVAPGRNMATLIEVACKVHLLRKDGYHAPEEIMKMLNKALT
jgi:HPr kinase/phosphorylase